MLYLLFIFVSILSLSLPVINFSHGPLQPHPGVTKNKSPAGTSYLSLLVPSGRTIHWEFLGGGRNVDVLLIDLFSCTFMIFDYILLSLSLFTMYLCLI